MSSLLFIAMYVALGFAFGYLIRLVMPYVASPQQSRGRNLGLHDRLIRFVAGVILLGLGIYFASALLLIFAGFSFFEALARWCAFYALLGKSSCPL